MSHARELSNLRFGKLIARWPVGRNKVGRVMWLCSCDCGKLCVAEGHHLVTDNKKSCGCVKSCQGGQSRSPEYRAFIAAQGRCLNDNLPYYPRWGGRGIEFRFESFERFMACVGPRPSAAHSLDRIDNDGHYEPGNVRWATAKEQAGNRRNSLINQKENYNSK